jgi:hypothetical protein
METIDLTPTWGEIGNLVNAWIASEEFGALKAYKGEIARAFATAQCLTAVLPTLTKEQHDIVAKTICEELKKQGY